MILTHMRNTQVADGVRDQMDLHLDRLRRSLGFDYVFAARVAGGERRIEAMSAGAGQAEDCAVGDVRALDFCPVVMAAAAEAPQAFAGQMPVSRLPTAASPGVTAVTLFCSSGCFFGVLGGVSSVDVDRGALAAAATAMTVGLDLLHDHATAAQRVRGLLGEVMRERLFHPVFQPVRDLESGGIIYREGLTRLDTDDGVTVPQMLRAAHSVGLGPELEVAFAQAIIDADEGADDNSGIAINLSEATLHSDAFAAFLEAVEPGLTVELTEYEPVRDYPALAAVVAQMRAAGLSLAIDDAGAGYTSLRHILDLKPDVLKMDAGMSARIDTDPEALALFHALQSYCDATGTLLVIEGVERPEQLEALRSIGVRYVQGFHLDVPTRQLDVHTG